MPHELDLIATLTGGLTAALVCGLLAHRLGLSPVVGYLIAGVLVGPFTPGYVAQHQVADQFAEIGVVLLMFGVGLHFQLAELLAVRRVAVPGALVQIACATALGILATRLAGWSLGAGLVFGLAISVASTVVLLRVLADHDALRTPAGHVAVGWLVVEDLLTVLVLVLLPGVTGARTLVFAASGAADETVRVAKERNPAIRILARTGYLRDVAAISAQGADAVVVGEEEVAVAMSEWIVRDLGTGGERLGGVRARLRAEFAD
jgi:CPA2 family monovalent cation:H+ antiporter-2